MSDINQWFLSLPKERQEILREDKWMLASAYGNSIQEKVKDNALEVLADYIVNNAINYVGGEFEREDGSETFVVVVAKESAHRALTEHNRLLQLENEQLARDRAELVGGLSECFEWLESQTSIEYQEELNKFRELLEKHK